MIPINFPGANDLLKATEEQSKRGTLDLPIHRGLSPATVNEDGSINKQQPLVVSAWKPTEDELKRLNEGKPLYIMFWGITHPPMLPIVSPIFQNEE